MAHGPIIAVPFYKTPELVEPLLSSLERSGADLNSIAASLLFIVDSPDDQLLIAELQGRSSPLRSICDVEIVINQLNCGFVQSINSAFSTSIERQRDIIILNSDVEVFEGAFVEMQKVAYSDHMIGFVNPRSNNATICTSPKWQDFQGQTPNEAYAAFRKIRDRFKRVTYTPTAVGFAMYVKWVVLKEIGGFDTIYGLGYNEENDLVMRANRCGYRSAIANHAFVYHAGEASFGLLEDKRSERDRQNARILLSRYPEYEKSLEAYFASHSYTSESLFDGLLPEKSAKLRVGFDLTSLGTFHNGTFEAAKRILSATLEVGRSEFEFFAICEREAFDFHYLDQMRGLTRIDPTSTDPVCALIRIGQPFTNNGLIWARKRAAILAIMMLDSIALDCAYLSAPGLKTLWQATLDAADIVAFNSAYSMTQFKARFAFSEHTHFFPLLHSTNPEEYRTQARLQLANENEDLTPYILVIGNKFAHKFLTKTLGMIEEKFPGKNAIVFGISGNDTARIRYVDSGGLTDEAVGAMYDDASVVLFPSHYEGFGFPIMHALARSKPVVARDMPVFREIQERCQKGANIHLFSTTEAMVHAAMSDSLQWKESTTQSSANWSWTDTGRGLLDAILDRFGTVSQQTLENKLSILGSEGAPTVSSDNLLLKSIIKFVRQNQNAGMRDALRNGVADDGMTRSFISGSILFDEHYYMNTYGDVALAGIDGVTHFLNSGWYEGRNPSVLFDANWYLRQNPDVFEAGMNPLLHFLCYGIYEGRTIRSLSGYEVRAD